MLERCRTFLKILLSAHADTWFAKLVVYGRLLTGVALIVGTFTGIAALLGGFTNWKLMLSSTASTNLVLFVISIGLILAWRVSGYFGAVGVPVPWIETPWGRP